MRTADFISAVLRNPVHDALFRRLNEVVLPDAWIVAGCLTQTAWPELKLQPPEVWHLDMTGEAGPR
ncbi:hypothetical protein [Tardiphaga sp. OK246]|jgi:hypothetical protein|uniref:hypothetical protein n=1 Tax=Tardiphaga sp. OK246 TaxID=1855307 RepID=UPI000B76D1AE|nr:hypothetical protein [Tardiphaga sp. OK246]